LAGAGAEGGELAGAGAAGGGAWTSALGGAAGGGGAGAAAAGGGVAPPEVPPFPDAVEPSVSARGASPAAMRAITCPTVTTSTLSVEISTIVSVALMKSPTFTCHSRIVPSLTDSPAAGVTTSIIRCAVAPVAIEPLL